MSDESNGNPEGHRQVDMEVRVRDAVPFAPQFCAATERITARPKLPGFVAIRTSEEALCFWLGAYSALFAANRGATTFQMLIVPAEDGHFEIQIGALHGPPGPPPPDPEEPAS
jgi:hypothetical protein